MSKQFTWLGSGLNKNSNEVDYILFLNIRCLGLEFAYFVEYDFYGVNITFQCFSQFLDVNVIPQPVLSSGACRERERATISFQVCGNKNPHFTHFTLVHLSLVSSLSESWVSSAPSHHSKLNYTFKPGNIPSMLIHHFQKNCNFVDTSSYLVPFHVWNPFRHLKYSISLNSLLLCICHCTLLASCTPFNILFWNRKYTKNLNLRQIWLRQLPYLSDVSFWIHYFTENSLYDLL